MVALRADAAGWEASADKDGLLLERAEGVDGPPARIMTVGRGHGGGLVFEGGDAWEGFAFEPF